MRILLILFLALCAVSAHAQATDCNSPSASPEANTKAQQIWESGTSPVYADATTLAQDLTAHGIHVQCIRRSVEENLFPNEKGAAWIKTDQGILEVWFLPTPQAAAAAAAHNRTMGSTQFFVQHQNIVFHINGCCTTKEQTLKLTNLLRKTYPS